jgi:hypothetical protein
LGGSGFGCIPPTSQASHMFYHFCKIAEAEHFFLWGVASAAYPLLRKPSLMFYRFFFQSCRSGGGLCPKPRAEALSSDPWGREGGKKGKKRKRGEGPRPQTLARTDSFLFSFCSFFIVFCFGGDLIFHRYVSPTPLFSPQCKK